MEWLLYIPFVFTSMGKRPGTHMIMDYVDSNAILPLSIQSSAWFPLWSLTELHFFMLWKESCFLPCLCCHSFSTMIDVLDIIHRPNSYYDDVSEIWPLDFILNVPTLIFFYNVLVSDLSLFMLFLTFHRNFNTIKIWTRYSPNYYTTCSIGTYLSVLNLNYWSDYGLFCVVLCCVA
jgi:hypothetical protein